MVFPVVMYGCESWTIKKAEHQRIDAFELWCWRRLSRAPWTARRSVLGVHWKGWCWSWNSNTLATWWLTHLKRPWCWERLRAGGEGDNREWDGWWYHQLDGYEFEWTLGDGDGQGGLVCCDSWGRKESDTTERLHWTDNVNVALLCYSIDPIYCFIFVIRVSVCCSDWMISVILFSRSLTPSSVSFSLDIHFWLSLLYIL